MNYGDADHPTAPSQIGHERYIYDANGNPTLVEDDSLNTERRMAWDEENRLMALSANGKTSRYTYNAAGERVVKSHGYLEGVYVNGAPQGLTLATPTSGCASEKRVSSFFTRLALKFHETEDYTIYLTPILSVTRRRFTKHYFIGRQAHSLQNRCGHIPKRLRAWRERRHGWAKRLPDAYDADRKTTRGLLPQAGHAAGSAHDEGRDGRTREHARGLQHHHQGAGRPQRARWLDSTAQAQRRARHASRPARAVGQGRRPRRRAAGLRLRACRHHARGHLLLSHRPSRLHFLHHRRQGQRRPVRRLPALRRTARGRTFVHGGNAV